ncbi:MAG: lysophospholipid acyltransferase family protein [Candidatus Competibacterales bacterium]|nr:lysophospholipid acyltransferase family protein [Candidatus Competibacterales bacterium]
MTSEHVTLPLRLRALLFYLGMTLSTLVFGPLILLSFPLRFERRYGVAKGWSGFNLRWLRWTCGIDYRVRGQENLPREPVIVLAKHQSTWETIFLQWYLPPLAWVLKRELMWLPVFGWALALMEPISIDRKASSVAVAQIRNQGKRHLDNGRWVLIFPEGTRSAPGQRQRYKLGGARLAAYTGYPILPIAHNAGEFWPRRSFVKHPGTIDVVIGETMPTLGLDAQTINRQVEEWIEHAVADLPRPTSGRTAASRESA